MNVGEAIVGVVAAGVLLYLGWALLNPEKL